MRCPPIAALLLAHLGFVTGHGAILYPRSRNSIDFLLNITGHEGCCGDDKCHNVTGDACKNGQAAHWYSQGCTIGCPTCDHVSGRVQIDVCGLGKASTIDPKFRSVNRMSVPGSEYDIYRHNPWRAPGSAPVADACGLAGGTPWGSDAVEEGTYINTTYAHHGMKGTDLPEWPTGITWTIGGQAKVIWQVRNNHGGGYSYRLCPASEPLTEACFQSHPLDFVRDKQALVFDGKTVPIPDNGETFVGEGTQPEGSTWARLPIPPNGGADDDGWLGPRCGCDINAKYQPANYDCGCLKGEEESGCQSPGNCSSGACLPCPGTPGSDCSRCDNGMGVSFPKPCDGCYSGHPPSPAVLDYVKVPSDLPPGKYVLGFRYDCEATAQVWNSCSDIMLAH